MKAVAATHQNKSQRKQVAKRQLKNRSADYYSSEQESESDDDDEDESEYSSSSGESSSPGES